MTVGISNNTNNSKYFVKQQPVQQQAVVQNTVPTTQADKNKQIKNVAIAVGGVSLLALAIFKGKSIAKAVSKVFKKESEEIKHQYLDNIDGKEETEIAESISKSKQEEILSKEIVIKEGKISGGEDDIDISKYSYKSHDSELSNKKPFIETLKEDLDPKINATPYLMKKDIFGRDMIKVKTKTGDYGYVILDEEVKNFAREHDVTSDELYEIGHFVQQKRINKYLGKPENELENMSIWQYLNKYKAERDKKINTVEKSNDKPINNETYQKPSSQDSGSNDNDATSRNRNQNDEEDGFWSDLAAGMLDF